MKRVSAFILCIVMAIVFAACNSKQPETSTEETRIIQETLDSEIKAQLDSALSDNKFDGVVQISEGGHVIYQYVSGNDDNNQDLNITSSLPVGSVSKQFCAACIMLLCDQKKLSVYDTLDKYFPGYRYGEKMKIKDLLTMSSGIPGELSLDLSQLGADEAENTKTIRESILNEELNFDPGNGFGYSNSNYFLLADIVEQISKVSYHDFLRTNFFEPLNMTSTGFVEEIPEKYKWTAALSKTELMDETKFPGLSKGAGDVVSNADDMDSWMQGLSSGKIISADAYKEMTGNPNPSSSNGYSYGLWQMPFDGFGHAGQIEPHFSAVDYLNTDRNVYLFAASNTMSGMSFMDRLPYTLLSILFKNE